MDDDLTKALSDSLKNNLIDTGTDLLEVGLDAFLDEGIYKDIPLISAVVGVYKIGHSISELHYIKKLKTFIIEINNGIATEAEREKYKQKILSEPKKCKEELEYLLIIINHYIDTNKSKMLAKFYLAYLDGKIKWEELTVFAEITDRFLPMDYKLLKSSNKIKVVDDKKESALRLMALGLLSEPDKKIPFEVNNGNMELKDIKSDIFIRTALGNKLVAIIEKY